MSQHVGVIARRAFQQNHFLLVDAGKWQALGAHQYRSLVDDDRAIRTVGENELPKAARVEDLAGRGYLQIPRLFAARSHGLVDVQKENGVMHRFAGLCSAIMQRSDGVHAERWRVLLGKTMADSFHSISATEFMRIAEGVAQATRDSALSIEVGDGALYVTNAQLGAEIFVELDAKDPTRAPQNLFTNGMYTYTGSGPVHLIGGADVLITSRSGLKFSEGVQKDKTEDVFAGSGMPSKDLEAMHLRITQEDSTVVFLHQGESVSSLPTPNHGVMMRAVEGGVGIWEGDNLIHVLEAGNGTTLLCHPEASMVQLKATTPEARLLKAPFKLS